MPAFDLDAAMAHDDTPPAFVYAQDVVHRGEGQVLFYLMLGPDDAGHGSAIAQLNWTVSGPYIRWFGLNNRWRKVSSLATLKGLVTRSLETEPTAQSQRHTWHNFNSGTKWSLAEWWAKQGKVEVQRA